MIEKSMKGLQTAYCNLLMLLYGSSVVMIGTLLPELIGQFSLTMSQGGFAITLQSIGGLATVFGGIALADRVPKSAVILGSFLVFAVLRIITGAVGTYAALLVIFFLSGIALRLLDTMLNALIGDIHQKRRGFHMNILHLFFSLGAFIGPSLASQLLNLGINWRAIYYATGLVYLMVGMPGFFFMLRNRTGANRQRKPNRLPTEVLEGNRWTMSHIKRLEMVLLGFSLLLYSVHQSGITAWLPHYMNTELEANVNISSYALSIFWVGIILSRLIASKISIKIEPSTLVTVGTVVAGVYLTASLLLTRSSGFVIVAMGFAGAATGAVIPLSMVIAHQWHPQRTGSTTAYLTLFLLAGHLLSPGFIGLIGDASSLTGGMLITSVSLLCCSLTSVLARKVHMTRVGRRDRSAS